MKRNIRISKKNPEPYMFSILTVHTDAEYTHGKITSFLGIYSD